jgi:hypothetical protein
LPILHPATIKEQLVSWIAGRAKGFERAHRLIAPRAIAEHYKLGRLRKIELIPTKRYRTQRQKDFISERIVGRKRCKGYVDRPRNAALAEPFRQSRVQQNTRTRGDPILKETDHLQLGNGQHPGDRGGGLDTKGRAGTRGLGEITGQDGIFVLIARNREFLTFDRDLDLGQTVHQLHGLGQGKGRIKDHCKPKHCPGQGCLHNPANRANAAIIYQHIDQTPKSHPI